MTETRKRGWAFWTGTAFLMMLVAYPVSFGPACWIASRVNVFQKPVVFSYGLLARAAWRCPGNSMPQVLLAWGRFGEKTTTGAPEVARYIFWKTNPDMIELIEDYERAQRR